MQSIFCRVALSPGHSLENFLDHHSPPAGRSVGRGLGADKPADPDTGESTVEESTLGLLPNPFEKYGIKFAATSIAEPFGNAPGGRTQALIHEARLSPPL